MSEAYIVDAVRTAVGKRGGGFAHEHPADLAANVIRTVVGRHDLDPEAVDDVILGCLDNIGSQAGDIARTAALAAGLPESVPGVTVDRQCGSAQQAVHFAAQAVMSGTADLIVAGGVQKMSQYPILSAFAAGEPFGASDPWTGCRGWEARYGSQEISQFRGAEMIASQWKLSREDNEVFAYSFPDTTGKIVSNEDPRFKGKVVLAIVTGTWCPNCHDEAQYLVQLYAKYHDQGLEIVALDFEEPDQQASLKRVNAFIKQYHVPYTYLIAGEPSEMWDKVPQAVNLNTWPATLFIGRDGKVKATHAGFASSASGIYNQELKTEFTSTIERLLKENAGARTSAEAAVR